MSTSAIFPTQSSYQPPSSQSSFVQDFSQLVSSLQSGNMPGAQQAYSALNQLQSSGQGASANPNSPVSEALSQIGRALQNGDLNGAQQALSSLQSHGGRRSHGHYHPSGGSATDSATILPASGSTVSNTNVIDVTA